MFLGGCGFHPYDVSKPLSLCVKGNSDAMGMTLEERLNVSCQKDSPILQILSIKQSQTLVSVSANNNTRQFALNERLQYQIKDKNSKALGPIQTISNQKPLTIDNNLILSSGFERSTLNNEMRNNLYFLLRLRLNSELQKIALHSKQPIHHGQKSNKKARKVHP